MNAAFIAPIFNKHAKPLRYPRISLIRCALAVPAALGTWQIRRHRVPFDLEAFANDPAKAELASMLPGFRFLFAAIVLSMSILVFGLGAAALLRAAHEEFASTPSWHASPEPVFAQRTETEGPAAQGPVAQEPVTQEPAVQEPVLAMLQVEPSAAEEKAPDQIVAAATPAEQPATTAVPAEPEVTAKPVETEANATLAEPEITAAPAEPETTVAMAPENSSEPETAKPELPVAESPAQQETAPAQAVAPAAADETKVATSTPAPEEGSTPGSEAAPAAPEQASPPASADADSASTKIATLGGPSVTIEAAPAEKTTVARHVRSVIRKRVEARRKTRHRRTASRVHVVQRLSQQPTDPFGQSFAAARRR
jgi:hypothetical protein